jgi:excisionase family DNA binding protein
MPLLNVEQAADRLGTSTRFIRRLIAERRIPFTKLGKHVRIDTADLDAFIAAGRVEANHWGTAGAWLPSPRSTSHQEAPRGR